MVAEYKEQGIRLTLLVFSDESRGFCHEKISPFQQFTG